MAQNPFYVYALKDPRGKPAKPFYIGKGTGNRAWEHQSNIDDSEKGLLIKQIREAGCNVIHTIIADNLTEQQALKIEAELISAFGIRSQGAYSPTRFDRILTTSGIASVRTFRTGAMKKPKWLWNCSNQR